MKGPIESELGPDGEIDQGEAPRREPAPGTLLSPLVAVTTMERMRWAAPLPGAVQRASVHVVIVAMSGAGSHAVDFEHYEVSPGVAVHVQPGQVHCVGSEPSFEGLAVLVDPDATPSDLFDVAAPHPVAPLGPSSTIVAAIAQDLLAEQERSDSSEDVMVTGADYLLQHVARAATGQTATPRDTSSPHAQLVALFRAEVERRHAETRNVSAYARTIGTSTKTLARATTGITGQTPKEIIDRRVVLEARRLLAVSSDSIAAIGRSLGFTEATNFTKFFYRLTGQTPQALR